MNQGFTILFWMKDDSVLLQDLHAEATRKQLKQEVMSDVKILIGTRWSMDMQTIETTQGEPLTYGINTRFMIGDKTIKNALGDLTDHVDFFRGNVNSTPEELMRYLQCKRKWNVPEVVTESTSSGWQESEQAGTSTTRKFRRT